MWICLRWFRASEPQLDCKQRISGLEKFWESTARLLPHVSCGESTVNNGFWSSNPKIIYLLCLWDNIVCYICHWNYINLTFTSQTMLCATSAMLRRGFASAAPATKLFINGKFVESSTDKFVDVHNPATNEVKYSYVHRLFY